jgi:hypothetical protein
MIYHYPDYLDFVKNERKTLQFLASNAFISKTFNALASSANLCVYNLPAQDRNLKKSEFVFGCNFNILIEKDVRRIAIEAHIEPNFGKVSYVLSICQNNATPLDPLLRKFHFDYAIPIKSQVPKPVYHLQFGGEETPQLKELSVDVKILNPWLSSPRICFYPINLALLLDMVFNEFKSNDTVGIVGRSEWRDLIKNNEERILKPFYLGLSSFLNGKHKSNFLLRDFYYGSQN